MITEILTKQLLIKIPTIEASIIDINNNIGNKVDKVSGKALSANDYTNVDKACSS